MGRDRKYALLRVMNMSNSDKNFTYPILPGWDKEDIITASNLYSAVANAYEVGIERDTLLNAYNAFKLVVPSKSEEKQIGHEFEKTSGYSIYKTIKLAHQTTSHRLKMED